jgi:hypothetical protein
MGLSLGYEIRASVSAEEARELVQRMRQVALDLPFEEVSDLYEWRAGDTDADPESTRFLQMMGTQYGKKTLPGGEERWIDIPPKHVIGFNISPAVGSETAAFGLATHPSVIEFEHQGQTHLIETDLSGKYSWTQVCKTQYAGLQQYGGVDNFLKAHLSLVQLLDEIAAMPVTLQVSDDSGYWDHRDETQLRQQLASWNGLIAAFAGQMKDQLGTNPETGVQAPILTAPDFEHLEAKGLDEWSKRPRDEE